MAVIRASAFSAIVLCAGHLLSSPLEVKVVGDRVNLRARPVFDAEVAGQVSSGVTLIAPDGIPDGAEWIKVSPPDTVDLWIFSSLVNNGIVTADDTYVRCGPGQQYKPVGKVGKGFKIEPRGADSGDWLRIAPVPTAELYISSAYVLAIPSAAAAETANISSPESLEGPESPEGLESPKLDSMSAASPASPTSPADPLKPTENPLPTASADTDAPTQQPTEQQPNGPTDHPANEQTEQTDRPTNRQTNIPTNRQTDNPTNEFTAVPAAIADYQLAIGPKQGEVVTLRGRLERLSLASAPSFSRYKLVDKAGFPRSTFICHIIGLQGQWHELTGSEIEIEGRFWTISDSISETIPIIDASRVRRIASWEK